MDFVVAVDVGGTRIKAGLQARDGTIAHTETTPTGVEHGTEAVVGEVGRVIRRLAERTTLAGDQPRAAGVAVPGVVDEASGTVRHAANIGWRDLPLGARLRSIAEIPTVLTHDVRAGGVAEGRVGAARGVRTFLFVAVGTGIGGAVIIDGNPLRGAHSAAAEVGHLRVANSHERCGCGATGCAETVASAEAIARRYRAERGWAVATAENVLAAARAGDERAQAIWDDAVEGLAQALLAAITVLDPGLVVVGGGLASAGPALFEPLRERLTARSTVQAAVPVVPAMLADRAGCLGAGLLAWDHVAAAEGTNDDPDSHA